MTLSEELTQRLQVLLQARVTALEIEQRVNVGVPDFSEQGRILHAANHGALIELLALARHIGVHVETSSHFPVDAEQHLYPSTAIVEHLARQQGRRG